MASTADSRLTSRHSSTNATTSRLRAKTRAAGGLTAPVTRGRFWVRCISRSMSRSTYMLMALAPPAARVPPTQGGHHQPTDGRPRWATIIVGSVVTSSSSMIRGLVRAT